MIALLNGRIVEKSPAGVIVDAGGVGYELNVPTSVLARVGEVGDPVRLRTYLEVKEDALNLYGFLERSELDIFRLLISISGVGPKLAVAVLSGLTPAQVHEAIARDDAAALSRVKGIGKKIAAKMLFELRNKIKDLPLVAPSPAAGHAVGPWAEASDALRSLGYKEQEISDSLAWAGTQLGDGSLDVAQVVRKALSYFGQSVSR